LCNNGINTWHLLDILIYLTITDINTWHLLDIQIYLTITDINTWHLLDIQIYLTITDINTWHSLPLTGYMWQQCTSNNNTWHWFNLHRIRRQYSTITSINDTKSMTPLYDMIQMWHTNTRMTLCGHMTLHMWHLYKYYKI
jgi:3-methyladenine DNA glycosylase AlkD